MTNRELTKLIIERAKMKLDFFKIQSPSKPPLLPSRVPKNASELDALMRTQVRLTGEGDRKSSGTLWEDKPR